MFFDATRLGCSWSKYPVFVYRLTVQRHSLCGKEGWEAEIPILATLFLLFCLIVLSLSQSDVIASFSGEG